MINSSRLPDFFRVGFLVLVVLVFGACQEADQGAESEGLFIVGTTTQIADALNILTHGASNVTVANLMGAGVDPHLYQPTESDVREMNQADLIVYSGLHLEGQFDEVFEALGTQGTSIYTFSEPVSMGGFTLQTEEGTADPHFWFDPRNFLLSVQGLAVELVSLDPVNAEVYNRNSTAYTAKIDSLMEWATGSLASVEEGKRYLVTSHDAFQYYGDAFGWQMEAIQGLSTEDEAGVGDVQDTVDFVIANQIPVLFVESSIPPDTIQSVQAAIQDQGFDVRVGVRELFGDAMGEPGTFGGTYIGSIGYNTLTILESFHAAGESVEVLPWPGALEKPPQEFLDWIQ